VAGPATDPAIVHPRGIAIAPGGGFVFADAFGHRVQRVLPDGTIRTIAGTGTAGFGGDGGPATRAELDQPHGVAFTTGGVLLVADALNNRIRAVAPDGTITTVAGNGRHGFSGDGGPATDAMLGSPRDVSAVPGGGYLIPDTDNDRVRRVRPDGTIVTVAGPKAGLDRPFAAVAAPGGAVLVADTGNDRILRISAKGTVTTVAGNGRRSFSGDGGPATAASLNSPHNLAVLPDGGFLIADEGSNRVRRVWPNGTITTVAGTGAAGFSGDGGAAAAAELNQPKAVAVLPDRRGFLVADAANSRIRAVSVDLRPALRLRLASRSLRARAGTRAALVVELSAPAALRIDVLAGRRAVARLAAKAGRGRHVFRLGGDLRPGRYSVTVAASAPLMRPAAATTSLVVTRVPR
jgi:sugar lactone lactonase YvrE